MKQFKMVFPIANAWAFCQFAHDNGIKIAMSWTEGGDFFDKAKIHSICQATDEAVTALQNSEWKKFVTN